MLRSNKLRTMQRCLSLPWTRWSSSTGAASQSLLSFDPAGQALRAEPVIAALKAGRPASLDHIVAIVDEGIKLRSWNVVVELWLCLLSSAPHRVPSLGSQNTAEMITTRVLQALVASVESELRIIEGDVDTETSALVSLGQATLTLCDALSAVTELGTSAMPIVLLPSAVATLNAAAAALSTVETPAAFAARDVALSLVQQAMHLHPGQAGFHPVNALGLFVRSSAVAAAREALRLVEAIPTEHLSQEEHATLTEQWPWSLWHRSRASRVDGVDTIPTAPAGAVSQLAAEEAACETVTQLLDADLIGTQEEADMLLCAMVGDPEFDWDKHVRASTGIPLEASSPPLPDAARTLLSRLGCSTTTSGLGKAGGGPSPWWGAPSADEAAAAAPRRAGLRVDMLDRLCRPSAAAAARPLSPSPWEVRVPDPGAPRTSVAALGATALSSARHVDGQGGSARFRLTGNETRLEVLVIALSRAGRGREAAELLLALLPACRRRALGLVRTQQLRVVNTVASPAFDDPEQELVARLNRLPSSRQLPADLLAADLLGFSPVTAFGLARSCLLAGGPAMAHVARQLLAGLLDRPTSLSVPSALLTWAVRSCTPGELPEAVELLRLSMRLPHAGTMQAKAWADPHVAGVVSLCAAASEHGLAASLVLEAARVGGPLRPAAPVLNSLLRDLTSREHGSQGAEAGRTALLRLLRTDGGAAVCLPNAATLALLLRAQLRRAGGIQGWAGCPKEAVLLSAASRAVTYATATRSALAHCGVAEALHIHLQRAVDSAADPSEFDWQHWQGRERDAAEAAAMGALERCGWGEELEDEQVMQLAPAELRRMIRSAVSSTTARQTHWAVEDASRPPVDPAWSLLFAAVISAALTDASPIPDAVRVASALAVFRAQLGCGVPPTAASARSLLLHLHRALPYDSGNGAACDAVLLQETYDAHSALLEERRRAAASLRQSLSPLVRATRAVTANEVRGTELQAEADAVVAGITAEGATATFPAVFAALVNLLADTGCADRALQRVVKQAVAAADAHEPTGLTSAQLRAAVSPTALHESPSTAPALPHLASITQGAVFLDGRNSTAAQLGDDVQRALLEWDAFQARSLGACDLHIVTGQAKEVVNRAKLALSRVRPSLRITSRTRMSVVVGAATARRWRQEEARLGRQGSATRV